MRIFSLLRSRATRRLAVVAVCGAFAIAPPAAVAHWSYIYSYATGIYGAGGTYSTPGYGHRHLRRVWHEQYYWWCTHYRLTDGSVIYGVCSTDNPTGGWVEVGYAATQCHNVNDNSGTRWTCQTTVT